MDRLQYRVRRGDSPEAAEALRRWREPTSDPGHPDGPDLREVRALDVDLLLLPGDIRVGLGGVTHADLAARYLGCPCCYSFGNHEPYQGDLLELIPAAREAATLTEGRVTMLEMDRADFEIRGQRVAVLGATLWTDYRVNGDESKSMATAARGLNDHALILYGRGVSFRPEHAREIHHRSRRWLGQEIPRARDEADVVIVMTHHSPVPEGNPPQYQGGPFSGAFVSDMRQEILDWEPDVWVWGHTHHSLRSTLGRTLLVSAQRGYIGQEPGAELFKPAVIEIKGRERG